MVEPLLVANPPVRLLIRLLTQALAGALDVVLFNGWRRIGGTVVKLTAFISKNSANYGEIVA
jgi:hypothetical protein